MKNDTLLSKDNNGIIENDNKLYNDVLNPDIINLIESVKSEYLINKNTTNKINKDIKEIDEEIEEILEYLSNLNYKKKTNNYLDKTNLENNDNNSLELMTIKKYDTEVNSSENNTINNNTTKTLESKFFNSNFINIESYKKAISELKSDILNIKKTHKNKISDKIKNLEEDKILKLNKINEEFTLTYNSLKKDYYDKIKQLQTDINKLDEDNEDLDNNLILLDDHDKIIMNIIKNNQSEYFIKQNCFKEIINSISLNNNAVCPYDINGSKEINNFISKINNISIEDISSYIKLINLYLKHNKYEKNKTNTIKLQNKNMSSNSSYSNSSRKNNSLNENINLDKSNDSDINFKVEDEYSSSDEFEVNEKTDEIKINKINSLKIDTEFFDKKTKYNSTYNTIQNTNT